MNDLLRRTSLLLLLAILSQLTAHAQWRKAFSTPGEFYNEVFFVDNMHGWITQQSTTVYRTIDGGTSWQKSTMPGGIGSANRDICFISTAVGFVSGSDGIWKSTTGGIGWVMITPPTYRVGSGTSCWFIDENNGVFAAGDRGTVTFYRTSNGGATWDSITYTGGIDDGAIGGMTYAAGLYYASGGDGQIWRSADGGATWIGSTTNSGGWQEDMVSFGSGLYIASADGKSYGGLNGGKLLRSIDGGITWARSSFPTLTWGISMYSSSEGWGCGDGGRAYKTTDGGVTWTQLSCGMDKSHAVDDIHFTDATHGWAVGNAVYQFVVDGFSSRPDTIDFGDVVVGSKSRDSNAIITALGVKLTITARKLEGLHPTQFGSSQPLGFLELNACQDGLTPLYFAPTSDGPKIAKLVYTISGSNETAEVILKGRGVKPTIASVQTMMFDTLLCSNIGLDTVLLRNTGTYALKITDAVASPVLDAVFRVISPSFSPTSPVTIKPGDSARFIVQVEVAKPGVYSGTISFTNNDPDVGKSPWNVAVTAVRRDLAVTMSGDSIDLPGAPLGSISSLCVTFTNRGDGPQIIQSVTLIGGDGIIKQLPAISNITVARGTEKTICFSATATDTLVHIARFRIRLLPCNRDTVITVRYQARNPVISTIVQKTFGAVLCDSGMVDTIVVRNNGNAPLILDRPSFIGAAAADFTLVEPETWPDTIPIGQSLIISVRLSGAAPVGERIATMIIPNNDLFPGKALWAITVRYSHGTTELTPSRRVIDVGEICINGTRTERVTILNTGSGDAMVEGITPLGTPDPSIVAIAPVGSIIAPRAGDSLSFTITPAAAGPFSSQFILRYGPCDRFDTITVTGRAFGIALAATPPALDYGSASIGRSVQRTLVVANNGGATATITAWSFVPALPGARVVSPQPPVTIGPGETRTVTVELTPADTGNIALTLLGIADGPCPDTLRAPIVARGVRGAAVTDRYRLDYGSLFSCSNGAVSDSVRLMNHGSAPITLRAVRLAGGTGSGFRIENPPAGPRQLTPGDSLTIILSAIAEAPGALSDTLLFELDQQEEPVIAVPVEGRRERADLAVRDLSDLPATVVVFDDLSGCGPSDEQTLRLRNTGTVADTVALAVSGASFTLRSASTLILQPGADTTITVRAAMSAPGDDTGLLTIRSVPCSLESLVQLKAHYGAVSATVTPLDFSTVNIGRTIRMTAEILNTGDVDQVVDHLEIDPPSSDYAIIGTYAGSPLPAQGSLAVQVSFTPTSAGPAGARIIAVMRAPCDDTLSADLSGRGIRSNVFVGTRGIAYGERLFCQDSCATVHVEATGSDPVTILDATLEGSGSGAYRVATEVLPLTVLPGTSADITICFDPGATGDTADAFVLLTTSDSAQPLLRLKLTGSRGQGLQGPETILFGGTDPVDTSVVIVNRGGTPIEIGDAALTGPYTVLTKLPVVVGAHDSVVVRVRYTPSYTESANGSLILLQSIPCSDSLLVLLKASTENERYQIALGADSSYGRWGERVEIPIALENPRQARIESIDLVVTADPALLDPGTVRLHPALAEAWSVARGAYNPATGALAIHMSARAGSAVIPSSDTLLSIDYLVLRGGTISSTIGIETSGLPAYVAATTTPGFFALSDYCDAHGRLLEVSGTVALDQNVPNPFNPTTTIEFETAFESHVRLTVHDELGREVQRPVDGLMPAGRGRVVIDATGLPSGVYTYRLTTGLQTLTRRMVVAK